MIKSSEYSLYNSFIESNFPLSTYNSSENIESKKSYYANINKLIEVVIIYKETKIFSEISLLILEEIRILLNKMLLYMPLNDSFILSAIIRALTEAHIKLLISLVELDVTEDKMRNLRFSNMKVIIDNNQFFQKYTREIEIAYAIFNDHSQIIHNKHKSLQNISFLDEQISHTTIDVNKYTRIVSNLWKLEFNITLELVGAKNQDFSLAHKTKLKTYLSKKEFEYLSFL